MRVAFPGYRDFYLYGTESLISNHFALGEKYFLQELIIWRAFLMES